MIHESHLMNGLLDHNPYFGDTQFVFTLKTMIWLNDNFAVKSVI